MSGKAGDKSAAPNLTGEAQARAEDREQRRAAALRANLARRKAQRRARQPDQAGPVTPATPENRKSS